MEERKETEEPGGYAYGGDPAGRAVLPAGQGGYRAANRHSAEKAGEDHGEEGGGEQRAGRNTERRQPGLADAVRVQATAGEVRRGLQTGIIGHFLAIKEAALAVRINPDP